MFGNNEKIKLNLGNKSLVVLFIMRDMPSFTINNV